MNSGKGISEILSVILIMFVTISLVGTAFMYGMPLITKRQDTSSVDRIYDNFDSENANSIVRKIEFVSKNGGQETFTSSVDGGYELSSGYLQFTSFSKVSNIAVSAAGSDIGWVALTTGGSCPPSNGIVGINSPYVVCAKAEPFSDGFNVIYRIMLRDLYDSTETKIWRMSLVQHESGQTSSSAKTVRISRGDVTTGTEAGKTLITTEVKILLV